ncbi:MAG: macro domain-containing protein, partial [Gammaproteobacteria bacterium]
MIYQVEGDIMLSRAEVIAHGVSTADPMIRGLASELHSKFPAMVEQFQQWCEETSPEPGEVWLWRQPGKISIVNMLIQEGDDDPTRIRRPDRIALNRCFRALNRLATEERFNSIAMPPVGAGEFALDWSEV